LQEKKNLIIVLVLEQISRRGTGQKHATHNPVHTGLRGRNIVAVLKHVMTDRKNGPGSACI